ncbi:hypothetical protein HK102_011734 [Quaeritorhiza haematococci]|nr:hypothetical protein HK102_011734 [Quaeritorhiza haematococci]
MSPASAKRVRKVIETVKPTVVTLELDYDRLVIYQSKHRALQPYMNRSTTPSPTTPSPHILSASSPSNRLDDFASNDGDIDVLTRLYKHGIYYTSSTFNYGMEVGAAIDAARSVGCRYIKAIDVHPDHLQPPIVDRELQEFVDSLRQNYRYSLSPAPRFSTAMGKTLVQEPSAIGRLLYRAILWGVFRKNILKDLLDDRATPLEYSAHSQIWSRFYPSAYHYWLDLRNAGMVERLKEIIYSLVDHDPRLQHINKPNHHHPPRTEDHSPPSIVAVVGKFHVFGMADLWKQHIEGHVVPPLWDVEDAASSRVSKRLGTSSVRRKIPAKPLVTDEIVWSEMGSDQHDELEVVMRHTDESGVSVSVNGSQWESSLDVPLIEESDPISQSSVDEAPSVSTQVLPTPLLPPANNLIAQDMDAGSVEGSFETQDPSKKQKKRRRTFTYID